MDPLKVSAQFAAYVWFANRHAGFPPDASQFAMENWGCFLLAADEGLGRLLIKIAEPRLSEAQKRKMNRVLAKSNPHPRQRMHGQRGLINYRSYPAKSSKGAAAVR